MDTSRLCSVTDAAAKYGMSVTTFWRFRRRHQIRTISGDQVHLDDVDRGIDVERGLRKPDSHQRR